MGLFLDEAFREYKPDRRGSGLITLAAVPEREGEPQKRE